MSVSDADRLRRSRVQLVLIVILFALPPAAAWVAWQYLGQRGVEATTNAGTLIAPARPLQVDGLRQSDGTPLSDAGLRGRWTYVLFAAGDCDERCRDQLFLTRQTRLTMNKDIQRIQRLLVLTRPPGAVLARELADAHPDLRWVVREPVAEALLQAFRGEGFGIDGRQFFLVDPLGNLMMFYEPGIPAKGVREDLRKLLRISQIG